MSVFLKSVKVLCCHMKHFHNQLIPVYRCQSRYFVLVCERLGSDNVEWWCLAFMAVSCQPFVGVFNVLCRWDEELVNMAQNWEPKENGMCYISLQCSCHGL